MVDVLYRQFSTFLSRYDVLQPVRVPVVRRLQISGTVLRSLSHSASVLLRLVSATLALWLCLHALESSGLFARLSKNEGGSVAIHSHQTFLRDVKKSEDMPVNADAFEPDGNKELPMHPTQHLSTEEATSVERTPDLEGRDSEQCPSAIAVTPVSNHGRRYINFKKGVLHLADEDDPGTFEEELRLRGCKRSEVRSDGTAQDDLEASRASVNSGQGIRVYQSQKVHFELPSLSTESKFPGFKSPCVHVSDVSLPHGPWEATASKELRGNNDSDGPESTNFQAAAADIPSDEVTLEGQELTSEKDKSSGYEHSFPLPASSSFSHSGKSSQNIMDSTHSGELGTFDSLDALFSPSLHSSERGLDYESDTGSGVTKDSPTARSSGVSHLTRLNQKARSLHRLAFQHEKDAEQLRFRAHCITFLAHNRQYNTYSPAGLAQLDLHQLPVDEALVFTRLHLNKCRRKGITTTRIVTGRGLHSPHGKPRIKPMVEEELKLHTDLKTWQLNPGSVGIVFLRDETLAGKVSST